MLRINSNTTLETSIGSATSYSGTGFTYTFNTNTFYFLTMTYDGANIKAYVNGVLIGTTANTFIINYVNTSVIIGGTGGGPGNSVAYNFDGKIYNVSMYNRGLTASEVLTNYTATKGRFGLT